MESLRKENDDLGKPLLKLERSMTLENKFGWETLLALGVAVVAAGSSVYFGGANVNEAFFVFAGTMAVAGFAILVWRAMKRDVVYIHEKGARHVRSGRVLQDIRFDEVHELCYQARRKYLNGTYLGTTHDVKLRSAQPGSRAIHFAYEQQEQTGRMTQNREVADVEAICHGIAEIMADRMEAALQRGETVTWTENLRLSRDGVEVGKRFGKPELIPWAKIERVDIDEGTFHLREMGKAKPPVTQETSAANFHPGYRLVCRYLTSLPAASSAPADESAERPVKREGGPQIDLRFTTNVQDHVAMRRRADQSRRAERLLRIWGGPGALAGCGVLIALLLWSDGKVSNGGLASGLVFIACAALAGGIACYFLITWTDRQGLERELWAAHQLWKARDGPNPFPVNEAILAPWGYSHRTEDGEAEYRWSEVTRVEWFRGWTFIYLAGDRLHDEEIGLAIPARAFASPEDAAKAHLCIHDWHKGTQGP